MPIMKEAVSKENFDRMEKGLAPIRPEQQVRDDPKPLKLENEIKLGDIPSGSDIKLEEAYKDIVQNEDGIRFVIFNVMIEINSSGAKKDQKTLIGWMSEGEFLAFIRTYRKQIDQQVVRW